MIEFVTSRRSRGFTLIELLVVILILAILMAVALPLYLNSQQNAEVRTCRSNLQTIAGAVQAKKVSARLTDYSTLMGAVNTTNEPDLQTTPICPSGGTYSVVKGHTADNSTFAVHCTIPAHVALGDYELNYSTQ